MGAAPAGKSIGPHSVKSGGAIVAVRANGSPAARPEKSYSPPNPKSTFLLSSFPSGDSPSPFAALHDTTL